MKQFILLLAVTCFTITVIAQNVGIGTNAPQYPFTVYSRLIGISQQSGTINPVAIGFWTDSANGAAYLQTHTKNNLLFATNNSTAQMVLDTLGRVGIGSGSPAAKLDVGGKTIIRDTLRLTYGIPGEGKVLTSDGTGNAMWQTRNNGLRAEVDAFTDVPSGVLTPFPVITTADVTRCFDDANAYNNNTLVWTCPATGVYLVSGQVTWSFRVAFSGFKEFEVYALTNGSEAFSNYANFQNLGGINQQSQSFQFVLKATKSSIVEVFLRHNAGVNAAIYGGIYSFLNFTKIY